MSFFAELKRRNVIRVGIAYVIVAWLLAQVADLALGNFHAPDWVIQSFLLLLIILFPLAIFFAWVFELTPEGIKKEKDIDRSSSITAHTGRKLDFFIIAVLVMALGYFAWDKFGPRERYSSPQATTTAPSSQTAELSPSSQTAELSPSSQTGEDASGIQSNSIAVLPFVNMSGDPDNEFFSDGVAEEILNVLARIPELKVAARTSAFGYKGTTQNISEIARELNVANLLEGSVRKSGQHVRVTAQLIKADDGFHLWSETYDRQLDDIFAIQDEIAQSIAEALKLTLKLESGASGNLTGTNSVKAYEHYLQGMSLWHLRTPSSVYSAIDEFAAAIGIDPGFARAYAGLALSWVVLPGYTVVDEVEAYANAEENGLRALELDPQLAEAWAAMGNVWVTRNEFAQSHQAFDRSIELNPSLATAYQWFGNALAQAGNYPRALENYQKAWELDPRSRINGVNYALALRMNGQFDASTEKSQAVLRFAPDFPDAISFAMLNSLITGDCAGVDAYGNRLAKLLGKQTNATQIYVDLCAATDPGVRSARAATIAAWPMRTFADSESPALTYEYDFALAAVELGEFDAALNILRELAQASPYDRGFLNWARNINTSNGRAFRCDPRTVEFFNQLDSDALSWFGPTECD